MTAPFTARALLTLLPATLLPAALAPLLTACGAATINGMPLGQTLAAEPAPPDLTPDDGPDPPPRVVRYARKRPLTPAEEAVFAPSAKDAAPKADVEVRPRVATKTVTATAPDGVEVSVTVTAPVEQDAPAPAPVGGAHNLARLHPEVREMARQLHAAAAAEGIPLTFISGYRAFDRHSSKARKGRASWHAFGMAFDVNLADRRDMNDALKHYARDEARWARVGAIAERLGLTWGLQWGRHEVFHFEWHPGMPEAIRQPTLTALLKDAGRDGKGIEKVWRRHWPAHTHDGEEVAARDPE